MEVVNCPEYLFEVEMCDIDSEATGLLNFISEITRIDRLMVKKMQGINKSLDNEERNCIP